MSRTREIKNFFDYQEKTHQFSCEKSVTFSPNNYIKTINIDCKYIGKGILDVIEKDDRVSCKIKSLSFEIWEYKTKNIYNFQDCSIVRGTNNPKTEKLSFNQLRDKFYPNPL